MSKDWTAGLLAILWLIYYWPRAKVIVSAPTGGQVKDILFKEIAVQYAALRKRFPDDFPRDALTTNHLRFSDDCFVKGFTTKETNDMIGRFQGFHSPNMLIILSEAQAISPEIFKQIRGLMTSGNSRLLELGNPLVPFGDFYEHCTNTSFGYKVIKLPVWLSPNLVAGKEVIPGMASREWLEEFRSELKSQGVAPEEDPDWQARVDADFPQQSIHAWIPLMKIKACVQNFRGIRAKAKDSVKVGGLDPAGAGTDETVHVVLEGNAMQRMDCFRKVLTPETVGWARALIEDSDLEGLAIDEGYNPGIVHWLNFEKLAVTGVNFGGNSPHEKLEDMGTYMWWLLRTAIMNEEIAIQNDPTLIYQLQSRRTERLPSGKIKLESKKKIRKSPDRADALALAWYMRILVLGGDESFSAVGDSDASRAESDMTMEVSGRGGGDGGDMNDEIMGVDSEASEIVSDMEIG